MKIGIIGYGSFGRFIVDKLPPEIEVIVFDPKVSVPKLISGTIKEVCQVNFLILAIPLSAYDTVLGTIKSFLSTQTVIVDISSVKSEPIRLIKQHLPGQNYIASHPLFGPESAGISLNGHKLIICETNLDSPQINLILKRVKEIGIEIEFMSADEHDREMAIVQALTFFVSRSLNRTDIHQMKLSTPSFKRLLHLASLDNSHTDELMNTILLGNKYALDARRKYMTEVEKLDDQLNYLVA